jgi:hypothetical protein
MSDKPIRDLPEDAKKKSEAPLKSEQLDEVVGGVGLVGGVGPGRLGEKPPDTVTHLTWADDHTAVNDT